MAMVHSRGHWQLARHLEILNGALLSVAERRIRRLLVTMPPRHGKSELASRYLPAWYLLVRPEHRVILASYEADFASSWGRKARDVVEELGPHFGVVVNDASSAANRWDIKDQEGGMVTAGAGGPITGRGADLFIIDDPIKNAEDAMSPTIRAKIWDWYLSTAYTRLEPEAVMVIIQTRWHSDDLAGKLLQHEPGLWHWLNLPALCTGDDLLGRARGEALWPERYSAEALAGIRGTIGARWFEALYQQKPLTEQGNMFKREWFAIAEEVPR